MVGHSSVRWPLSSNINRAYSLLYSPDLLFYKKALPNQMIASKSLYHLIRGFKMRGQISLDRTLNQAIKSPRQDSILEVVNTYMIEVGGLYSIYY